MPAAWLRRSAKTTQRSENANLSIGETADAEAVFQRLFDASFRLEQRKGESLDSAAERLFDDVVKELPRLERYLYG